MTADPVYQYESEDRLTVLVTAWPDRARALVIDNDEAEQRAADLLGEVKVLRGEINDTFDPISQKQYAAWKETLAQKKRHDEPLDEAERIIKRSLGGYRTEKENRALAQRREDEERRRRMEEDLRIAEAAAAEDAGDHQAAEELISAPIHVAPPAQEIAKPSGVTYRETWSFEITSLLALVQHCAANPQDLNLLTPNTTAIRQLVTARKAGFSVPGVRVWMEKTAAAAKRR